MILFDAEIIAFTAVAAALAVTPGADTMLVIKNSLRNGKQAGWATTIGVLGGTLFHALISALGISLVIAQSEWLFHLVKMTGAAYLVWLGIQTLRTIPHRAEVSSDHQRLTLRNSLAEGLITNLLNPKVAIFYIAFLPQFISPGDPVLAKSILLACIHNILSLVWLGGLATAIGSGRNFIQQPSVQQWLSRLSGIILIGLGVRLALESR
ncbi:MAG: LysE family translocator [Gammaproteobacteria bacterium]|nr:LysE family translocator [Gammaproteobacteria bacterium]